MSARLKRRNMECSGWMDGWVGGWMDGWVDGWMEVKAGLRIAYSNQKSNHIEYMTCSKYILLLYCL